MQDIHLVVFLMYEKINQLLLKLCTSSLISCLNIKINIKTVFKINVMNFTRSKSGSLKRDDILPVCRSQSAYQA